MPAITDALEQDVPGILAIFNDVIATTTAVYREEPVALEERLGWMKSRVAAGYPVLVARDGQGVAGFASFGEFRAWPCYRNTVEHTVHVRADVRGQGVGLSLVLALLPRAQALGKHVLVAGVDAGNAVSLRLHQRLGFTEVARFREVGRKFDRWLDLVFLQRFVDGP
ncbi:MAG: N-acetyltransferase family protein [Myxococcaceae bacterium]